jgi:hypothetical protein
MMQKIGFRRQMDRIWCRTGGEDLPLHQLNAKVQGKRSSAQSNTMMKKIDGRVEPHANRFIKLHSGRMNARIICAHNNCWDGRFLAVGRWGHVRYNLYYNTLSLIVIPNN